MTKKLTNNEIIDQLLTVLNLDNDNQLATYFKVERQQIYQFRQGKRTGLTQAIITELLSKLDCSS